MVFFLSSVHAKIIEFSVFVICGKPLDRDSEVEATINEESFLPSLYTFVAFTTAPSIQVTITVFSFIHSMSTRPIVLSSLTFTGSENAAPPSLEKATLTSAFLSGEENHATATLLPVAAIRGPLTGQPSIFQLSANIDFGAVHCPFTNRTIDISLI